ncbi:MAG TPA: hypothetical protein VLF91_06550 [Candidatus Saccharimonadales bacterium]|nr:hypothetical protein [Candidatus Saccharimonadales bacterium]
MKLTITVDTLTMTMEGAEKLWALKSKLVIPRGIVSSVLFVPEVPVMQDFAGYLRAPGTNVPWRFLAGTYWRGRDREFWLIRMKEAGLITIELEPKSGPYRRVRFTCDPPSAQRISDWWSKGTVG